MDTKERILKQAHMYLEGYSLRQIALETNQSHVSVYYNLQNKLKEYDLNLYNEVMTRLKQNQAQTIDSKVVSDRVKTSSRLLREEDKTVEVIAEELETTPAVIYRDLTKRLVDLSNIDEVTTEEVREVLQKLQEHKMNNLVGRAK